MSSAALPIPRVSSRVRADVMDRDVLKAGRRLLAEGPVCFKLSSRVDAGIFPWWVRRLYVFFCRKTRKVPPQPAEQLDVWTSFAAAVRECRTPDDQLLVMRFNRKAPRGVLELSVECRPKDPADEGRYAALAAVFGGYGGEGEDLEDLRPQAERLSKKCEKV